MKKKIWGFSITLALVISLFIIGVPKQESKNQTAEIPKQTKNQKQTFKEKSLQDSYKDALSGISDKEIRGVNELGESTKKSLENPKKSNIEIINTSSDEITRENNEQEPIIEEYQTEQILTTYTNEEKDTTTEEIVVTKFVDITISEENDSENSSEYSVIKIADKGDDKWDSSQGVKGYSRFYYTKSTASGGDERAKLTKVTGGWTVDDSSIKLSGRTVTFGCSGWPAGNQSTTKKPTGNSFSYTPSSSWKAASIDAEGAIGVTTKVTLKRNSSTWSLKLNNNL